MSKLQKQALIQSYIEPSVVADLTNSLGEPTPLLAPPNTFGHMPPKKYFQTTPFESLVHLYVLWPFFSTVRDFFVEEAKSESAKERLKNVKLATIHSHNSDPFLLLGEEKCIVVGNHVSANRMTEFYQNLVEEGVDDDALDFIYKFIISGDFLDLESKRNFALRAPIATTNFRNSLFAGYLFFVFAHEFTHVLLEHGEKQGRERTPHPIRALEFKNAMDQCEELSKMYGKPVSPNEYSKERFFGILYEEVQADVIAIITLIQFNISHKMGRLDFVTSISGALMFFAVSEAKESACRTLTQGTKWMDEVIFTKFHLAEDLLFRTTHPSPRSRILSLQNRVKSLKLPSEVRQAVDSAFHFTLSTMNTTSSLLTKIAINPNSQVSSGFFELIERSFLEVEDETNRGLMGSFDFLQSSNLVNDTERS